LIWGLLGWSAKNESEEGIGMFFKKESTCCSGGSKKCPNCGLEFKNEVPARCPRCNGVMPHQGCEGCKHKH
jgi:hypothetical protein